MSRTERLISEPFVPLILLAGAEFEHELSREFTARIVRPLHPRHKGRSNGSGHVYETLGTNSQGSRTSRSSIAFHWAKRAELVLFFPGRRTCECGDVPLKRIVRQNLYRHFGETVQLLLRRRFKSCYKFARTEY